MTQVVVYPRSVEALAHGLLTHLDPGRCRWCRREVGSTVCPWCQLPRSGLTRQVEAEHHTPAEDFLAADPHPTDAGPQEVLPR